MSTSIKDSAANARPEHLDAWFESRGFEVEKPNQSHAAYNMRRITSPKTGTRMTVAYKTDRRIVDTSSVFIETYSVVTANMKKPGWARDARIDAYVIYSPQSAYFWFMTAETMRENLERWETTLDHRSVQNDGYLTEGVIIPESEIRRSGATCHILSVERGV